MSRWTELAKFYARQPRLLARHALRATRLIVTEGPSAIRAHAQNVAQNVKYASAHARHQQDTRGRLVELLKQRRKVEAEHRQELIATLLPFAQDLRVLDVLHDEETQLRVLRSHIFRKLGLFDDGFYKSRYLGQASKISPMDHYLTFGIDESLWPNPVFDPAEYLIKNSDIAGGGLDPLTHYALFGWREGRPVGSLFDTDFYLKCNPDVLAAGLLPMGHYLTNGRAEGRLPKPPIRAASRFGGSKGQATRGVILLVSHDAEIGGAQSIVMSLAKWFLASTHYNVQILCMKGGPQIPAFQAVAPVFNFEGHERLAGTDLAIEKLKAWAGDDLVAALVNSVASGRFFAIWGNDLPVVSYVHELPKIIARYGDNIDNMIAGSKFVVGGSEAVRDALVGQFKLPEPRAKVVYDFVDSAVEADAPDLDRRADAKRALGVAPDVPVILGCGVVHWRKSPDKFIEVAKRVIGNSSRKARFIWIGDGEDMESCLELVASYGLEDHVEFVGFKSDIAPFFAACNLFLLPSEEDPFPLVCMLAALNDAPVICFEDAGGMPEFVAQGCGRAVEFGNVDAMAQAVQEYLDDDAMRQRDGERARACALENHTIRSAGPRLLDLIRQAADVPPSVSVVVPNYNYEAYLRQRLDSVYAQSFQDFEVILLDDCSTDGSVEVLKSYADRHPATRLLVNDANTGSPFKQWMKGLELARAELVWIAEADDFCEPDLLGSLMPIMQDRNVFLGYAKSVPVNSDGEIVGDYESMYLNRINPGRWAADYTCTDHEEINNGLGIANCIPNASSVIMWRFAPDAMFRLSVTDMRLCGDWYFYIRAIRGGQIGYCARPLNYHRRHATTVTQRWEGSDRYFQELAKVRQYVSATYKVSEGTREKISKFVVGDLDRFGIVDELRRQSILDEAADFSSGKVLPSLLVVTPDLSPGGGQVFNIELANAWVRQGGRAFLLNVRQVPDHPEVLRRISPRVQVFHANEIKVPLSDLIDALDVDVIQSSIWWADRYVLENLHEKVGKIPWIVTTHGCYETLLADGEVDGEFEARVERMLQTVSSWVYTAEKNLEVFDKVGQPDHLLRINNGMPADTSTAHTRKTLGVRSDSLLLCLASRGISSKGWHDAVEITKRLNTRGIATDLMLIGEGEAEKEISENPDPHVHLFGQVSDLGRYVSACDVGLLPSYFVGESMPLILIEMMGAGKPVVATDAGEIRSMITSPDGDQDAGIVVPLVDGMPDIDDFVDAIASLADAQLREKMGGAGKAVFERQFTMQAMLQSYRDLYAARIEDIRLQIAETSVHAEPEDAGEAELFTA